MLICGETKTDWSAVRALNMSAFMTSAEANLVDALRKKSQPVVSLVAKENETVVGHIMFSPVTLTGCPDLKIMGLAPMAVAPQCQRKGIGSTLVRVGLERCRQLGFGAVVVLGHTSFYPRFGFKPSSSFCIGCEYEVPEDLFMVIELQSGYLIGRSGTIKYHEAFRNV